MRAQAMGGQNAQAQAAAAAGLEYAYLPVIPSDI